MQITVTYYLHKYNDKYEYECAKQSTQMLSFIEEFKQELRTRWKHKEYEHEETEKEIDEIYEKFFECLNDYNINTEILL